MPIKPINKPACLSRKSKLPHRKAALNFSAFSFSKKAVLSGVLFLFSAFLLNGCHSSVASAVSSSCSMEVAGAQTTIEFEAPSEDEDVTSVVLTTRLTADQTGLGPLENLNDQTLESLRKDYAAQLGADEQNVKVEKDEENQLLIIQVTVPSSQYGTVFGINDAASRKFSDLKAALESQSAICS